MPTILLFKLCAAPVLILGVTWLARRFGPIMGGVVMGLPLLTGPISLFTALEHGAGFAARAATTNLVGQVSTCVFCFVYAATALRYGAGVSAACGILAFLIATALWSQFFWSLTSAIVLFTLGLAVMNRSFPRPCGYSLARLAPWWELPARMIISASFILAITAVSARLGAQLSGLIAPFPVFVLILVVFTHVQDGCGNAISMAKGVLHGAPAFACFFTVVALGLPSLSIALTFTAAAVLSICCSGGLLLLRMRRV